MKETNSKNESLENKLNNTSECSGCGTDANSSRRKFTKGALAAPILASLISQPAWGTACSISGLRSTNLSGHDHEECEGFGCTPGFWKENMLPWSCTPYSPGFCTGGYNGNSNQCNEWDPRSTLNCESYNPDVGCGQATPFNLVFPFISDLWIGKKSLLEVMILHEEVGHTYYFHLVAALLNASCDAIDYGSTPAEVIQLALDVENGLIPQETAKNTLDLMNNRGCPIGANYYVPPETEEEAYVDTGSEIAVVCKQPGKAFNVDTGKCEKVEL